MSTPSYITNTALQNPLNFNPNDLFPTITSGSAKGLLVAVIAIVILLWIVR